ncbi:MAG: CBS domain-containing protein [Anaerolineales bacterium]|jgi:CBS domain-containing protein
MDKTVRDLMHRGLITCPADAPLGQVAQLLDHHHIHSLLVADGTGRPVGILTDFDLLAGEWLSINSESLAAMRKMTAGELMTTPLNKVKAELSACEAAGLMRRQGVSRLVVEEGGQPVGVISVSDLVEGMVQERDLERRSVADVMSRCMLICREETPLHVVARGMTDAHYRSVIVVDSQGRPLGVVSGLDMLVFCESQEVDRTAGEAMHPMLTVRSNASLREAANKMIQHHHHRLVVIDPHEAETIPLGVISSFDIVEEMAQPSSAWQG